MWTRKYRRRRRRQAGEIFDLGDVPAWLGWLFIYTFVLFYFSVSRFVALKALVIKYSSVAEYTTRVKAAVMGLGFLEDFVCTTYFATLLCIFDSLKRVAMGHHKLVRVLATFFVSSALFLAMMAPFIADLLLVVHRDMRFSSGLVATIIREREHLKDAPITEEEVNTSYVNALGLMMVATFFGLVRAFADWTDLSQWNPTHLALNLLVPRLILLESRSNKCINKNAVQDVDQTLEEGEGNASPTTDTHSLLPSAKTESYRRLACHQAVRATVVVIGLVLVPAAVVSISSASSPLVAYSALNATLNELFANALQPAPTDLTLSKVFGDQPAVKTGITGGAKDTNLTGMPQFFTQKGYETWFTTGSSIDLDGWDIFLPTHGFDTVWDNKKMMELAEGYLGITHDDWLGAAHRGLNWGVHDDLSFQILGDLLVNKTKEQNERVSNGESKNPFFVTHYTISSHAPFDSWPKWYSESEKPDFSAFYEGRPHADMIQRYLEVRYFCDMELGKFMNRMATEGILNDTVVIITGDHGQAPEADVTNTHEESMTRVAAAIVAEGRLGDAVGLMIEDAVEHYDFLNTLADITGVPEGGFLQNGVGRSLKRKVPYGERVVFSNEPNRKMSIVRGHQRLRYDQVSDSMMLHDTESDHAMNIDLFPNLTAAAQAEWQAWRDNGRRLAAYYTKRWDENCLLAVNCTTEH
ncbi:Polycomb group RING finger protein 5-A [Phytophthora nicotianae]|uniref:Polycomb group RING finger protein 5-A n=1 Tax=Phytophthora nicotianae TaxID=4792 RepID=A0A0W8CRA8_PHYNI|nr:Polycomb group RING finger protein 5-A [Phytophthora nicotianae]